MRKPLNTSVPEELIVEVDDLVQKANGSYRDRSHLVEQAVRTFINQSTVGIAPDPLIVRAGAAGETSSLYETSLFPRMRENREEKRAIAACALSLIESGQTLFIDGSTTCIELARLLAGHKKNLTVVTNSTLVCLELGKTNAHKVIGIGGDFDSNSASFVGPLCEEIAGQFFVDLVLVSTKGLIPSEGTYESNMGTLRVKQVFARNAKQVTLLADHTKFQQKSLRKVLDISQITTLITDNQSPPDALALLRAQPGLALVVAPEKLQKQRS